jgi:RimJ/RimL family protein N-acetyltransferase
MSRPIPELRTERLVMRGHRADDADAFAELSADDEVMRWVGGPMERGRAWRHMATLVGHWELRGYGRWALEVRETGELVGHAGLWCPEGWPGIEVGWTLARAHWGSGLATEAARASLEWGWRELGLDRVISLIDPGNLRSQAVARRIGAHPTDEVFHYEEAQLTVWETLRPSG